MTWDLHITSLSSGSLDLTLAIWVFIVPNIEQFFLPLFFYPLISSPPSLKLRASTRLTFLSLFPTLYACRPCLWSCLWKSPSFLVTRFSFYYFAKAGLPINFLPDPWKSEFVVSSGGAGSCLLFTSMPCWMAAVGVLWALSSGDCRIAIPFTEILMPGPWAKPLGHSKQSFQLSWDYLWVSVNSSLSPLWGPVISHFSHSTPFSPGYLCRGIIGAPLCSPKYARYS